MCTTLGCIEIAMCAFGCFEPTVSLTCIGECSARGCADVRFFVDQLVNCALGVIFSGGDPDEIMTECRSEFIACLSARCP
jgi:hypothetical protein